MGTAHEAIVSLGFIIPEPKLVALLQVLREHKLKDVATATDESGGNSPTAQPSTAAKEIEEDVELTEDEVRELLHLANEAATRQGLHKYFEFTMRTTMRRTYYGMAISYLGQYEGDSRGYCASTWGNYDVEPAFMELPELNRNDVVEGMEFEEKIQLLRKTLHFKEAMIEVEETWILRVEVG